MSSKYFNRDLCKRFVSDNNIPMPIPHDEEHFFYYIDLYESLYHSRSLWDNMCDEIEVGFNGDVNEFLDYYYDVRERMIQDILSNPMYQEFLKADMKQYRVCDELKSIPKGNVYNGENIGKVFLSIDLRKANFQALHYFDPSIVKGEDTYEEYVSRYACESEYIQNSKYTRQVVFGKCNPARQITIEKYLMSEFYQGFKLNRAYNDILKLIRFNNDELVYEIIGYNELETMDRYCLTDNIKQAVREASKMSGVKVSYDIFQLKAFCLSSTKTGKDRNINYMISEASGYDSEWGYKFKEVPLTYHALVYKLINCLDTEKRDYYFNYEGLDAYIDDDFIIKRFYNTEDLINDNKEEK